MNKDKVMRCEGISVVCIFGGGGVEGY